ncbi:MAG: hypothetical protein LBP76_10000 [Treponema sp.]|jgi:hypothetical protein|nr:hypothetical protein [Treponema sp.]
MKRFFPIPMRRRAKTGLAAGLLLFLPLLAYSQHLGPADIDIFVEGYGQIKPVLEKHKDEKEDIPWIGYNALLEGFSKAGEDFVRKSSGGLADLRRRYQELLDYKTPPELEGALRGIGWEKDGNKKLVTITLCWAFLYTGKAMKSDDVSGWAFKLFLEKYYEKIMNILEIFDEHDLALINTRLEAISGVMIEEKDGA